jgi:hypothetical protein
LAETEKANVFVFDNAKGAGKLTETLATMIEQEKYLSIKASTASKLDEWHEKKITDDELFLFVEKKILEGS